MKTNDLPLSELISLKKIKTADAKTIYKAIDNNRDHLRTWLPFVDETKSIQDTQDFVNTVADGADFRQEIFTIWLKDEFCGLVGLKDLDFYNKKVELGYWMIKKMTGKGIATLSVSKIMDYCFTNKNLNRIQIKCGVGNFKSSAIPKRLGFKFEGIERDGERHSFDFIDLEVYSILRKEWH